MADNLLLDRRRSSTRRANRDKAWAVAQTGTSVEVDDRPTVEEELIARERLAAVSAALARLPDRTSHIFRRFRIDGVPQNEIAAELGISVSAVEKHLQKAYHALVRVQAALDADVGGAWRP
jgi:RNA polymerase sigma-70 factor (ECF subfamily)